MSLGALAQAMDFIRRQESARTPEIATFMGMSPFDVEALLQAPREQGLLVACDVEVGDGERITEYRHSAAGGTSYKYRQPNKPVHRATPPAPRHQSTAPQVPAKETSGGDAGADSRKVEPATSAQYDAARAVANQGEPVRFKERVIEIFRKHGPLTSRELKKHHGIRDASRMLNLIAGNGEFSKLGGTPKNTIFGLPDQKLSDRKLEAQAQPDAAPRSIRRAKKHRKAAKHPRKSSGGGSAAMRRKRALKAWKTRRKGQTFRPALAADGAILLLGAKRGDFEIPREHARALVDINRRLTGAELTDLVMFVTRLDGAEIGA